MQTERPHAAFELTSQQEIDLAKQHFETAIAKGERPTLLPLTDEEYKNVQAMDSVARAAFVEVRLKQERGNAATEQRLKELEAAQSEEPRNREERRHGRPD